MSHSTPSRPERGTIVILLVVFALLASLCGIGVAHTQFSATRVQADFVHAKRSRLTSLTTLLRDFDGTLLTEGVHRHGVARRIGRAHIRVEGVFARSRTDKLFLIPDIVDPLQCECTPCLHGQEHYEFLSTSAPNGSAEHGTPLLSTRTCVVDRTSILTQALMHSGNLTAEKLRFQSPHSVMIVGAKLSIAELSVQGPTLIMAGGDIEIGELNGPSGGASPARVILVSRTGSVLLRTPSNETRSVLIAEQSVVPEELRGQYTSLLAEELSRDFPRVHDALSQSLLLGITPAQ